MTLDRLRPAFEGVIAPSVRLAQRVGLTPNRVTIVAFALAVGAGAVFGVAPRRGEPVWYLAGAALVAGNGFLDVVDGELARELGTGGPAGDMLDHVLDRYSDIAIVAGLAAGVDQWAVGFAAVTGVVMTSYLGTQAEAEGLDRVYAGFVGRADRIALVVLAAVAAAFVTGPVAGFAVVTWLLVFFAVVGHLTAAQRFYYAYRAL
ncbi:MAG: CDP-alcohol phosphatidyltransferase family protein [Haloarculaceae archaeon]